MFPRYTKISIPVQSQAHCMHSRQRKLNCLTVAQQQSVRSHSKSKTFLSLKKNNSSTGSPCLTTNLWMLGKSRFVLVKVFSLKASMRAAGLRFVFQAQMQARGVVSSHCLTSNSRDDAKATVYVPCFN
mmetsp:Transcript_6331/g.19827  ORF Transcript_6331/g.19827 Transcript_6331/m.19827 type:complete len:128 (+) Transcript_6331:2848-3231(+)